MADYMQEQLLVILTTTLSLLTAWAWNSALQQYVDQYYGRSLSTRLLLAVVITIVTIIMINWVLKNFRLEANKTKKAERSELKNYIQTLAKEA